MPRSSASNKTAASLRTARTSASVAAYRSRPMVRLQTMLTSAAPSAPPSADAAPPPGVGSPLARLVRNSWMLSDASPFSAMLVPFVRAIGGSFAPIRRPDRGHREAILAARIMLPRRRLGRRRSGASVQLIECVPNFSEGRRPEVIAAIRDAAAAVPGVTVLDLHADPVHNRMVLTFVGGPAAVSEAAFRCAEQAARLI